MNAATTGAPDKESILLPAHFKLEDDLTMAYHMMEYTNETLFLTGRAGTGKSTLLNYFRKNTTKKYVVLAPTGLAALQVGGGTIHSFFGFPLRTLVKGDPEIQPWGKGHPRLRILRKMDTLVIDEISMVRADILDAIDLSLRLNMDSELPFGGKQLIFIGDVFQLSPVVSPQDFQSTDLDDYESPYFFSADAFRASRPKVMELKKIYRQQDDDFIYLLNRIRVGTADTHDLDALNSRFAPDHDENEFAISLTSVNALADQVNLQKLMALKTHSESYKGKTDGAFDTRLHPASASLSLRVGAQVMMVKNDLQGRWVNGTIGMVEHLTPEVIMVRFPDGNIHRVDPVTWERKSYTWDKSVNTISFEVLGTYTQYPIRLAWAITIHKSQGLTFDNVIIDMGRGAFAHGQLYVALSRCKTLGGITLRTKLQAKDMIVDEAVEYFAGRCGLG
ncbi:ATP-dependent DNA helicase [Chryseolinea lacunae]|uniref:AAA family ATPase n=1 Tax=Chryseolinea lacunae TaxID=2801331 RepID=A0ABS1KNJ2_9BACT|nr:DEAD/DEAH box helicase [Chryseolinea lacunae]MBL0740915.1 AAA family ATPase [Chryseolinea lacunae]